MAVILLQFGLLGLAVGSLYTLIALGIVIIHRGSGVINFAQGAIAMGGAYIYWSLHDNSGFSFVAAFCLSVGACAALGVAIQLGVMRPLRAQSPLARMLASLGILVTITSAVGLRWPEPLQVVPSSLPTTSVHIGSIYLGEDKIIITAVVLAVACALHIVYRFTKFGLATTAGMENPLAASTLGRSPNLIASVNWALGCALGCVAGILVAPITGLSVEGLTLLALPAFAAVVIGNFGSFPIVVVAAMAIGVVQSEMTRYVSSSSGWTDVAPFLIVLVFLAVRGNSIPGKADVVLRLPKVGSGRIRLWAVAIAAAAVVFAVSVLSPNWVAGITATLGAAIVVLSLVVVIGYAGQLSLAQFALAGLGAWATARLIVVNGFPFWAALIVGALAALPVGVVVGLPALRSRGANLAIATLGLSVTIYYLILSSSSLTGGVSGFSVPSPSIFGIDISSVTHPRLYAIFALIIFVMMALMVANLRRSRTGRALLAVRNNERAAASLRIDVISAKLYAFGLAAVIAALGGILIAFVNPSIDFSTFDPLSSVTYVGYGVIGGVGFVAGPLFGSTLALGAIGTNVVDWFGQSVQNYLTLATGLILIAILILNANGIAAVETLRWQRIFRLVRRLLPQRFTAFVDMFDGMRFVGRPVIALDSAVDRGTDTVARKTLRAENLVVRIGGVHALTNVSIEILPSEVVGLIGPNGAGKTTFIDVVSGFTAAESGSIFLGEVELTRYSPLRRARLGIGRSFQSLELFEDLTVEENLLAASEDDTWRHRLTDLFGGRRPSLSPSVMATIKSFGLLADLTRLPGDLPYGKRRLVAIARSLAAEPSVLLLDEPAAGLSEAERDELSGLLRRLAAETGVGVLLVEHDVELVMRTCDRIVALDFGRVIARGAPAEIRANQLVVEAYLGEEIPSTGDSSDSAQIAMGPS
jgi:ABC-type branched-subunit amino acid transport system ATPase component/branched-subunit amino acid ABC-type transport system permease component